MERELIGANLRRARQALRLSQTAVATVLGLSRQAVSASESGKRAVTVEELWKAANLYRHPVEWFFKPQPLGSHHNLGHVQHRANAKRPQLPDPHDEHEIQIFGAMLEEALATSGAPQSIDPCSFVDEETAPFRNLSRIAERVRTKTDVKTPPINVYRALSCLGIRVRMTSLNTISGAFVPGTDRRLPGVLINSNQPSDRQRYSAAHELAHCILGHAGTTADEIVSPLGRRFESKEVEADSFASEFLMPAALVGHEVKKLPASEDLEAQVYRLADRFLVSYQAMVYRLSNLNAITPAQKEMLLALRPSDIEKKLQLSRERQVSFDPAILEKICASSFPENLLRDVDGVRQLQEVAFEEYARQVPEPERADTAGAIYEKVAVWVAETYRIEV